jgi:hypothetical protein
VIAVVTGVVHPSQGGWYFEEPIRFPGWMIVINQSQFHVFVEREEPDDLETFLNEVSSMVQGYLDSLGYHLATSLRAEIKSMVVDGTKLVYRTTRWDGLLPDPSKTSVAEEALRPFMVASIEEPLARLALADLRGAIESPDDTVLLTYRAVESVRQWFLDSDEDDPQARKKSWSAMRSTLGVNEERVQTLSELAKSRRHGGATPSTGEERKEALLIARDVVARFVHHLNTPEATPSGPVEAAGEARQGETGRSVP